MANEEILREKKYKLRAWTTKTAGDCWWTLQVLPHIDVMRVYVEEFRGEFYEDVTFTFGWLLWSLTLSLEIIHKRDEAI